MKNSQKFLILATLVVVILIIVFGSHFYFLKNNTSTIGYTRTNEISTTTTGALLKIVVIDSQTKEKISNVEVMISSGEWLEASGETQDGLFSFSGLEPGPTSVAQGQIHDYIVVHKAGYESQLITVDNIYPGINTFTVYLKPQDQDSLGSLTIKVIDDATLQPLDNASIDLYDQNTAIIGGRLNTNASGIVTFSNLTSNMNYSFVANEFTGGYDSSDGNNIMVKPGNNTITVKLHKPTSTAP